MWQVVKNQVCAVAGEGFGYGMHWEIGIGGSSSIAVVSYEDSFTDTPRYAAFDLKNFSRIYDYPQDSEWVSEFVLHQARDKNEAVRLAMGLRSNNIIKVKVFYPPTNLYHTILSSAIINFPLYFIEKEGDKYVLTYGFRYQEPNYLWLYKNNDIILERETTEDVRFGSLSFEGSNIVIGFVELEYQTLNVRFSAIVGNSYYYYPIQVLYNSYYAIEQVTIQGNKIHYWLLSTSGYPWQRKVWSVLFDIPTRSFTLEYEDYFPSRPFIGQRHTFRPESSQLDDLKIELKWEGEEVDGDSIYVLRVYEKGKLELEEGGFKAFFIIGRWAYCDTQGTTIAFLTFKYTGINEFYMHKLTKESKLTPIDTNIFKKDTIYIA